MRRDDLPATVATLVFIVVAIAFCIFLASRCKASEYHPCRSFHSDEWVSCVYYGKDAGVDVACIWNDETDQSTCEGPDGRRFVCSWDPDVWSCLEVK